MNELLHNLEVFVYLGGTTVILVVGLLSFGLVLVLYRLIFGVPESGWTNARAGMATVALASMIVLPLPFMVMLRPGIEARQAIGAGLYQQNCAPCHGDQGNRLPAVPLGSRAFLDELGRPAMSQVIRDGKGVMPAWGTRHEGPLGDEQIEMVTDYLFAVVKGQGAAADQSPDRGSPGTPTARPRGTPGSATEVAQGKELYQKNCTGCHGDKGDRIPTARFASEAVQDKDDATLTQTVAEGTGAMMAFGKAKGGPLADDQIAAIISYLRSLKSQ